MAKLKAEDIILNKSISKRIVELRQKTNKNQSQFAKENCIDRQTMFRWENPTDERGISIHSIQRFCKMMKISLKEFFDSPHFNEI